MSEIEVSDLGVVAPGSIVHITSKSYDDTLPEVARRIREQIAAQVGHDKFAVVVTVAPASISIEGPTP